MKSLERIDIAMTSLLLTIAAMTDVRADDFEELNVEEEVGLFTDGYFKTRTNEEQALRGWNGTVYFKDDLLFYSCSPITAQFLGNFPPFKQIVHPTKVAIRDCTLPPTSLAEVFQNLNISVPTIEFLSFATLAMVDHFPKAKYMEGFNLKSLFIEVRYTLQSNIFVNNPDFLKPLSNLTTFMVWGGIDIPKLPEDTQLEVLSLRHEAQAKEWKNCKHLRVLSIHNVAAYRLPRFWPEDCQNLTKIRLKGLTTAAAYQIEASITDASANLETLYMQNCNLTNPPYDVLKNAKNLKHLNLRMNRIIDETLIKMPFLQNLTNLDLSKNFLKGTKLFQLVKQMPNLQYLNLDGNRQFIDDFCNLTLIKEFATQSTSLERLSFKDVRIRLDCFENILFPKLEHINLESSYVTESVDLRKLPMTNAKHLEVNLRGRQVKWIDFNSEDYFALRKGDYHHLWGPSKTIARHYRPFITVLVNNEEYDCRNHWFCLAVLEFPDLVKAPDLNCSNSKNYNLKKFENLNCSLELHNGCVIENDKDDNDSGIMVRCKGVDFVDMQDLSEVYRITKIDVQNNSIATLNNMNLPESLQWIDLRSNNISRLDASDLAQLFNNPNRSVLLSNNSFICDCDLVLGLHEFRFQIEDYDKILCEDTEQLILKTTLCTKASSNPAFIITASVVFVIQVTLLSCWYRNRLKRYFYRRGWCLCCCQVEENDAVTWQSVEPPKTTSQEDLVET